MNSPGGGRAREWAFGAARGFCVGAADLVPGVSGATVALVLGIYERLLAAIRAFDHVLIARLARLDLAGVFRHIDIAFLVPLAIGALGAAVFFTRVVPLARWLEEYPERVHALFFGLVAAMAVVLFRDALAGRTFGPRDALPFGGGVAAGLAVALVVPASTPDTAAFVFLSGMLAASAMLLPGVSGAYVLVLLKKYAYVLGALGRLDLAVLIPFLAGVAIGFMLFSRIVGWFLEWKRRIAMFALTGLVTGSVWSIWPYRAVSPEGRSLPTWPDMLDPVVVLLMLAGVALVIGLDRTARRRA